MNYFKITSKQIAYLQKNDALLAPYINEVGRIEREVNSDVFEALVFSIISQQISKSAALTVFQRLRAQLGEISFDAILKTDVDQLQKCGLSWRKTDYLRSSALAFKSGLVTYKEFDKMTDQEIIDQLVKIKGVGIWTAQMLLIFSLQRLNVISYDDLMIRKAIMKVYKIDNLTKAQFEIITKSYHPYSTIASLYLWEISHI